MMVWTISGVLFLVAAGPLVAWLVFLDSKCNQNKSWHRSHKSRARGWSRP
jgi:hypothetical protein